MTYYKDGLWVQPIDGGEPRKLEIPKYRSAGLWRLEYSRDGKKVALTLGESHRDAVLLPDFR